MEERPGHGGGWVRRQEPRAPTHGPSGKPFWAICMYVSAGSENHERVFVGSQVPHVTQMVMEPLLSDASGDTLHDLVDAQ